MMKGLQQFCWRREGQRGLWSSERGDWGGGCHGHG